jgi:hypothetical protein
VRTAPKKPIAKAPMPVSQHAPSAEEAQLARLIAHAALACWLISLALPGFVVQSRTEPLYGAFILLLGLLFGWMVMGWAAYANLSFPYVLIRIYMRKASPIAAPIMLLLGLTVFVFEGVVRDEGSGAVLPVVSWGVGAILWGSALLLTAIASGLLAGSFGSKTALRLAGGLGVFIASLGALHLAQRFLANEQERAIYLSGGMVFTTAAFCGVPFSWPEKPLLPPDEVVKLDVEPGLKDYNSGSPYLLLPRFSAVEEEGTTWRTWHDPVISSSRVKVRYVGTQARYALQARRTADGAVLRLVDGAGTTLYEQPLKSVRIRNYSTYCPYATQSWEGLKKGYDTALLRAVGERTPREIPVQSLKPQRAAVACSLGEQDLDGVKGLRTWDGRQAVLEPESVRTRPGFCSEDYIGLVYVFKRSETPGDLSPVVQIYDRGTLRPLASFNDGRVCPSGRCGEAPRTVARAVRILGDAGVAVETEFGDLPAKRITN